MLASRGACRARRAPARGWPGGRRDVPRGASGAGAVKAGVLAGDAMGPSAGLRRPVLPGTAGDVA